MLKSSLRLLAFTAALAATGCARANPAFEQDGGNTAADAGTPTGAKTSTSRTSGTGGLGTGDGGGGVTGGSVGIEPKVTTGPPTGGKGDSGKGVDPDTSSDRGASTSADTTPSTSNSNATGTGTTPSTSTSSATGTGNTPSTSTAAGNSTDSTDSTDTGTSTETGTSTDTGDLCGNDIVDRGEDCEASVLHDATCGEGQAGEVDCTSCLYDYSECCGVVGGPCGVTGDCCTDFVCEMGSCNLDRSAG